MIAELKGRLSHKSAEALVVDVGGVGYELFISKKTFNRLPECGQPVNFLVHTHLTETSLTLYGFTDLHEKIIFRKLISVSGIGPRLAIQILSGLTGSELVSAILNENLVALTGISGIGKKTAERLIVELKDKVLGLSDKKGPETQLPLTARTGRDKTYEEVLSALMNLGYNKPHAEQALRNVAIHPESTLEEVLKRSLSTMAG